MPLVGIDPETERSLRNLYRTQLAAVLSTAAENDPYSCLVSFAVTDDLGCLVFSTKRDRKKYRNIAKNGRVSVIVDDRRNAPNDTRRATSVTISGLAEEAKGKERTKLAGLLLSKHPHLASFIDSDDTAVMKVRIQRLYVVTNFESVRVIDSL